MTLELQAAEVHRDGQIRLGPLDLSLDPAGISVVLGPNGAGKSLFLRMIHGIFAPDRGTVRWNGAVAMTNRAERGFVFQATPVLRRSVKGNVEIAARGSADARRLATEAALERVGLTSKAMQPAATLSGGEKQRMALARALVGGPQVVLLDEPSASLDRQATERLEAILAEIGNDGISVILATHDLNQARRIANRVLLFAEGHLLDSSPAEQFFGAGASAAALAYLSGGDPMAASLTGP